MIETPAQVRERTVADLPEAPAWAEYVEEWRLVANLWFRTYVGTHLGARLKQTMSAPRWGDNLAIHYYPAQVLELGPACPTWCEEHWGMADEPLGTEFAHRRRIQAGDAGCDIIQENEPSLDGSPAGPKVYLDDYEWIDGETIRHLATALTTAADLIGIWGPSEPVI